LLSLEEFASTEEEGILDCGDEQLKKFATERLSYKGSK